MPTPATVKRGKGGKNEPGVGEPAVFLFSKIWSRAPSVGGGAALQMCSTESQRRLG